MKLANWKKRRDKKKRTPISAGHLPEQRRQDCIHFIDNLNLPVRCDLKKQDNPTDCRSCKSFKMKPKAMQEYRRLKDVLYG